jgi:Na+/H+ antiporter NhaD/arsenite permease-like protein
MQPPQLPQTLVDLTGTGLGIGALAIFLIAYGLVIAEEFTEMRKSKPMVIAAGVIWLFVALAYERHGGPAVAEVLRHNLLDYAEVMLFLLVAMTYVNTLAERNMFAALRDWLVARGFGLRALFWLTGALAFPLSAVLDNLTTALVMGAVVMAVGAGRPAFIAIACINVVVAANAGGAFSPFGDITTLMVWQAGRVQFWEFFRLFLPAAVNWFVPALVMSFAVPRERSEVAGGRTPPKPGGFAVAALFALTIVITVTGHNLLHLPPVLGMMTGLGLLQVYGYFIRRGERRAEPMPPDVPEGFRPAGKPFDIFISMKRVEWDTLMFFYGVVMCVGGLGALGYLALLSNAMYAGLGATTANIMVGIVSAVVDNIPVMFAVLNMNPDMAHGQWLLVTLTAGVGGSLLSVGSAAGVALMGQARGVYTFFAHLRWAWAIALGYALSIWTHIAINRALF